jgi:hypothetical protein
LVVDAHLWKEDEDQLKGTWQRDFLTPDSAIVGSSQAPYRTYLTTVTGWKLMPIFERKTIHLKGHGNEIF